MSENIAIVGFARTPMGGMLGDFSSVSASELGAVAISAAIERSGVSSEEVDELLMGNVLGAGQGQAPARQAGHLADLPRSVPAVTLNKMCGSGMKAVMLAHDQLRADNGSVMVAGGMESMTNAPYILPRMRSGARIGHGQVVDHMMLDGLEDAYEGGKPMGSFAEDCAEKYGFTKEEQDAYALESLRRAKQAQEEGWFTDEIAQVSVSTRRGTNEVSDDEQPKNARPEKVPNLKPAFRKEGTITAATSASISDGAAALVLMREDDAIEKGLDIKARIVAHASHSHEPQWFTTAPIPAIQKVLSKADWDVADVDLWEINEAFAVVPMAAMRDLGLSHDKVNISGGACALGHPIGATGARLLVTLLSALERTNQKRGVASLCIGGGEGTAVAIERVD